MKTTAPPPSQSATGGWAEAHLFGGRMDGRDVLLRLANGLYPDTYTCAGVVYHADGMAGCGLPRYSLPQYAGKLTSAGDGWGGTPEEKP